MVFGTLFTIWGTMAELVLRGQYGSPEFPFHGWFLPEAGFIGQPFTMARILITLGLLLLLYSATLVLSRRWIAAKTLLAHRILLGVLWLLCCLQMLFFFMFFKNSFSCDHHPDGDDFKLADVPLCSAHGGTAEAQRLSGAAISLLVLGDFGRDGLCCSKDVALEMAAASRKLNVSMVLNVGDSFYSDGIEKITDAQVNTSWYNVFVKGHPALNTFRGKALPWYATLGNHDYYGNVDAQIALEPLYKNWKLPSRFYDHVHTVDGVSVHVFHIDTQPFVPSYYTKARLLTTALTPPEHQRIP